jgi:hypothetical protein
MGFHDIDPLLERIRTVVAETEQLVGAGADETAPAAPRHELAQLKSLLAKAVSHEAVYDSSAAA